MRNNFKENVYRIISSVPRGKVTTYGQVASLAGFPKAARAVGSALHFSDENDIALPWWRVINSYGEISTKCEQHPKILQKTLLILDGVEVRKYKVDLAKYLYRPNHED